MGDQRQIAVFGGGCFWCTEAVFDRIRGVLSVVPGYAGGESENPTYETICAGKTGHAEVIRIEFDSAEISFRDLLTVFFATHDPTTLNQQGNDVGTQYRSIVLYADGAQQKEAQSFIEQANKAGLYERPIVTELKPLTKFYAAEQYHHNYFANNPGQPYCFIVINPKIDKLNSRFGDLLKGRSKMVAN